MIKSLCEIAQAAGLISNDQRIIRSICNDSRQAEPGCLFIARRGVRTDGHDHIDQALIRGAAAVIIDKDRIELGKKIPGGIACLAANDTFQAEARIAPFFYDYPSAKMKIMAVTGTNGKTTTTYILEKILQACGIKTGVIGTINMRWNNTEITSNNTTPEPLLLQKTLGQMHDDNVKTVMMEVSSHALALNRVQGMEFDSALFTNLTQDHLDFHRDMQAYLQAKLMIFSMLKKSLKKNKTAVSWRENFFHPQIAGFLASLSGLEIRYFSLLEGLPDANLFFPENIEFSTSGTTFILRHGQKKISRIKTCLVGEYNALNLLGALSALPEQGILHEEPVKKALLNLSVPGRLEIIPDPAGRLVVVDYAHTHDALEKVLGVLKKISHNRLICVFGCGGDRDKKKRPLMGQAACRLADHVIITSDNPRTEDPLLILHDIETGIKNDFSNYQLIPDRHNAISAAIKMTANNDIILLAGKGHETYQEINGVRHHFDDRLAAAEVIRNT